MIAATIDQYFAGFEQIYFNDEMKGLEKEWTKCIKLKEDVELMLTMLKNKIDFAQKYKCFLVRLETYQTTLVSNHPVETFLKCNWKSSDTWINVIYRIYILWMFNKYL